MASIQDVVDAAYRIGSAATNVSDRGMVCAQALDGHEATLLPLIRGSRSGEEAAQEVRAASRAVRESAARMLTLKSSVDDFVRDATK